MFHENILPVPWTKREELCGLYCEENGRTELYVDAAYVTDEPGRTTRSAARLPDDNKPPPARSPSRPPAVRSRPARKARPHHGTGENHPSMSILRMHCPVCEGLGEMGSVWNGTVLSRAIGLVPMDGPGP